ncbi:MAG: hypothetical protein CL748_06630 [Chloroflexi bacterium]|nr:hypothetical protein [Chloroflexota bacterium]
MEIPKISIRKIIKNYESILFDSYGVLFDGEKPIEGSKKLINYLNKINFDYFILTNDASITDQERSKIFIDLGLNIDSNKIISSGSLIFNYLEQRQLTKKKCFIYGTESIRKNLIDKGIILLNQRDIQKSEIIIFSDVESWPSIDNLNQLLNLLYEKHKNNKFIRLILPNPDIIYPVGDSNFNFGAAAFVDILEKGLYRIFGEKKEYKAIKIGKPSKMIFEIAKMRCKSNKIIMIGDQIETDILGANKARIDSALVTTGINNTDKNINTLYKNNQLQPNFILESIRL